VKAIRWFCSTYDYNLNHDADPDVIVGKLSPVSGCGRRNPTPKSLPYRSESLKLLGTHLNHGFTFRVVDFLSSQRVCNCRILRRRIGFLKRDVERVNTAIVVILLWLQFSQRSGFLSA